MNQRVSEPDAYHFKLVPPFDIYPLYNFPISPMLDTNSWQVKGHFKDVFRYV